MDQRNFFEKSKILCSGSSCNEQQRIISIQKLGTIIFNDFCFSFVFLKFFEIGTFS